jgi:hypothetical protein
MHAALEVNIPNYATAVATTEEVITHCAGLIRHVMCVHT